MGLGQQAREPLFALLGGGSVWPCSPPATQASVVRAAQAARHLRPRSPPPPSASMHPRPTCSDGESHSARVVSLSSPLRTFFSYCCKQ